MADQVGMDSAGGRIAPNPTWPIAATYAGLFSVTMGVTSILATLFLRSGLPTPSLLPIYCAVLLIAAGFAPFLLPVRILTDPGRAPAIAPLAVLAALALPFLSNVHYLLAWCATGAVALVGVVRAFGRFNRIPFAGWLFILLAAPLAALHVFPVGSMSYVYAAETAPLGLLDNATYFQAAVTHMIQLHGVPSVGSDGLQLLHYHFGSHFWFASVGATSDAPPLFVYPFAHLGILVPVLYISVLLASAFMARPGYCAITIVIIAVGLLVGFDALISRVHNSSESYTFSLAAFLLILPLVAKLHEAPVDRPCIGLWVVVLLTAFVITALKVSTGYVLTGMLAFTGWRRFGIGWQAWIIASVLAGILILAKTHFSPRGFVIVDPMVLLASYKQYVVPETFFSLLLPLGFLLIIWFRPHLKQIGTDTEKFELTISKSRLWARLRSILEAPNRREELWLAGLLVAFIPVISLPIGSNAVYFSAMPHWILLPVLAAKLANFTGMVGRSKCIVGVLSALLLTTLPFLPVNLDLKGVRDFLSAVDESVPGPKLMNEPRAMKRFFAANLADNSVLFSSQFVDKMQQNAWRRFVADLSVRARESGAKFAVFVPLSNGAFWNKLAGTGPYWCADMHLYIPSQAGAIMLKGLPPLEPVCPMFAPGSPDYGTESHTSDLDDEALCRHAANKRVEIVQIVNSVAEPNQNRTIFCNRSK